MFGYGLALQQNSPYLDLIGLEVLLLRQNGFLSTLQSKWMKNGTCVEETEGKIKAMLGGQDA